MHFMGVCCPSPRIGTPFASRRSEVQGPAKDRPRTFVQAINSIHHHSLKTLSPDARCTPRTFAKLRFPVPSPFQSFQDGAHELAYLICRADIVSTPDLYLLRTVRTKLPQQDGQLTRLQSHHITHYQLWRSSTRFRRCFGGRATDRKTNRSDQFTSGAAPGDSRLMSASLLITPSKKLC